MLHPTSRVFVVLLGAALLASLGACRGRRVISRAPVMEGTVVMPGDGTVIMPASPGAPPAPGAQPAPGAPAPSGDPVLDEARRAAQVNADQTRFLVGQQL